MHIVFSPRALVVDLTHNPIILIVPHSFFCFSMCTRLFLCTQRQTKFDSNYSILAYYTHLPTHPPTYACTFFIFISPFLSLPHNIYHIVSLSPTTNHNLSTLCLTGNTYLSPPYLSSHNSLFNSDQTRPLLIPLPLFTSLHIPSRSPTHKHTHSPPLSDHNQVNNLTYILFLTFFLNIAQQQKMFEQQNNTSHLSCHHKHPQITCHKMSGG